MHNRDALMVCLREVLQLSHLYVADWRALQVEPALIYRVVDLIRRFESNGLQLNGDGIRILHKLAESAAYVPAVMAALADPPVLELLLRLSLEHPVYDACLAVLGLVVAHAPPALVRICEMGRWLCYAMNICIICVCIALHCKYLHCIVQGCCVVF
jgi:hypothetical protein